MKRVMVNGELIEPGLAAVPVDDPGFTTGWTVFETARVVRGELPQRDRHLQRLAASAQAAWVPCPPRSVLEEELEILLRGVSALARLRVTLSGSGLRVWTLDPLDAGRRGQPVRAARGPHGHEPFLGGAVKHGSRAPWRAAVARSGVDEVLLVEDGRFTEATTAAIVVVRRGALVTAPQDGTVLASTTVDAIVEDAAALQIPVVWERPEASGPWDGLYLASATRWLSPVVELDGVPLGGWEPVGRRLLEVDVARTA